MQIFMKFSDRGLSDYAARLGEAASEAPVVLAQELNAAGAEVRQATAAAETKQTGLPADTINRALDPIEASSERLAYTITSRGGNVRLKYFDAVESGSGVKARPWGEWEFFPGAFRTSGRLGDRKFAKRLHGQVYRRFFMNDRRWNDERDGSKTKHKSMIVESRSGLFISDEMTKGPTLAAFEEAVDVIVAPRIVRRLGSLLP